MTADEGTPALPHAAVAVPTLQQLAGEMIDAGCRRIRVLAWRDLEDVDAGGSELHADHFMRRWAATGLQIVQRTSAAAGLPPAAARNGYLVERRGSRYTVFPRAVARQIVEAREYDALVEVWNGVPWFSPLWCHKPRITFLHHVHGPMWDQLLPGPFAHAGRLLEARLAPPFYRRTLMVTPSEATRQELLGLKFRAERVVAVNNGVEASFVPGGVKAEAPTIVSVGRLAPVKRQDELLAAAAIARRRVPDLQVVLVGDGPLRPALEAWVRQHDAAGWVTLAGHRTREELVALYQQAWVVASASLAEGWGLTMTEAAACGTPAVATDISGHRSSVVDGVTGVLAPLDRLGDALADVLTRHEWRAQMAAAALARARTLTWDASALGILRCLHGQVLNRR